MDVSRIIGTKQIAYRTTQKDMPAIEDLVAEVEEMQKEAALGKINMKQFMTLLGMEIEKTFLRRRPRNKAERDWISKTEGRLEKVCFPIAFTSANHHDEDIETHLYMYKKMKQFLVLLMFNNLHDVHVEKINAKYEEENHG